jgi:hypothetical protein
MKYIITEQQLNDIPEGEPSKGKTVRRLVQDIGLTEVAEIMGGINRVIELGYNGDLMKFSEETTTPIVYLSTDGMNLYLHEALVNELGTDDKKSQFLYNSVEKELGKFKYGSKNLYLYAFTANLLPAKLHNQTYYRVVGTSGDSGFGYGHINKKNTLGKRYRQQIFKQIIDKYDLSKYMTVKTFY